jgi:hypothetical protein
MANFFFRKMVSLPELLRADQQQIQERLRQQQREQNKEIIGSNTSPDNHPEKRQSSITEFIE